jgi:hypothetical protein
MSGVKAFATALLFVYCAAAAAQPQQLRTIPPTAKVGTLSHLQDMTVDIDGTRERLAPGAQIRDPANRLMLPVAIPPGVTVKYLRDEAGRVNRVWLLTRREMAQLPPGPPAAQQER